MSGWHTPGRGGAGSEEVGDSCHPFPFFPQQDRRSILVPILWLSLPKTETQEVCIGRECLWALLSPFPREPAGLLGLESIAGRVGVFLSSLCARNLPPGVFKEMFSAIANTSVLPENSSTSSCHEFECSSVNFQFWSVYVSPKELFEHRMPILAPPPKAK